jgi:hypothetical protein
MDASISLSSGSILCHKGTRPSPPLVVVVPFSSEYDLQHLHDQRNEKVVNCKTVSNEREALAWTVADVVVEGGRFHCVFIVLRRAIVVNSIYLL